MSAFGNGLSVQPYVLWGSNTEAGIWMVGGQLSNFEVFVTLFEDLELRNAEENRLR